MYRVGRNESVRTGSDVGVTVAPVGKPTATMFRISFVERIQQSDQLFYIRVVCLW
jgi:hypothetical protein